VEIAELINLVPCLPGIGAAPDRCLETCGSEVGSTEQNQIGVIMAKANGIEIGFEHRTLIGTKWNPSPAVLATVQSFLGNGGWPT
jgi:hypothetical protein